ncbi:glucose-dependent insulinotropic receptor-like [Ptychodera flava]|uniref:glucose-dependent insulinotropic receptor-like n=1 Tax=Ptychodera flava TaxID=63121 RepID=UPI003969E635
MGNFFDLPIFERNMTNLTNATLELPLDEESWTVHHTIMFVILILESVLIFSGNILILVSICINKAYLRPSYIFVISLAVADLFVGLVCVFSLLLIGIDTDSQAGCLIQINLIITSCSASIYSILVIAYDRYLAITKPLKYIQRMSRTREIVLVIGIWTAAFLLGFIPTIGSRNNIYEGYCSFLTVLHPRFPILLICLGFLPPLIVMIYFYAHIYSVSHKHSRQIADLERAMQDVNQMKLARELKAAKTVAVVIGCFILTWLPFFIALTVTLICAEDCQMMYVLHYLLLLGFSNSAFNPWVYVYWNKEARERLCFKCRKKLARIRGRPSVASECSISSVSQMHRRSAISTENSYINDEHC